MTELHLYVSGADDTVHELNSLYRHLVEDDELLKVRKAVVHAPPRGDDMGSEEVIRLVLEPSVTAALSACVTAWITRKSRLRITVKGPGGSAEIEVDGHVKPATIDTVARAIEIAVGSEKGETSE
ncbi:effector-associated constant component EACC1 [Nocardia asiatica]|uniref:effector-associated constant component EACC1 n=1 Tax=Nocardia asiatica TaxID=209252 RepID=UPI0012F9D31E|nr:hypothetical protein [Nocardia asiatica]